MTVFLDLTDWLCGLNRTVKVFHKSEESQVEHFEVRNTLSQKARQPIQPVQPWHHTREHCHPSVLLTVLPQQFQKVCFLDQPNINWSNSRRMVWLNKEGVKFNLYWNICMFNLVYMERCLSVIGPVSMHSVFCCLNYLAGDCFILQNRFVCWMNGFSSQVIL